MALQGSYKASSSDKQAATANRRRIVDLFVCHGLDVSTFGETLTNSDDDLDALVSALTAALSYAGKTTLRLHIWRTSPLRGLDSRPNRRDATLP